MASTMMAAGALSCNGFHAERSVQLRPRSVALRSAHPVKFAYRSTVVVKAKTAEGEEKTKQEKKGFQLPSFGGADKKAKPAAVAKKSTKPKVTKESLLSDKDKKRAEKKAIALARVKAKEEKKASILAVASLVKAKANAKKKANAEAKAAFIEERREKRALIKAGRRAEYAEAVSSKTGGDTELVAYRFGGVPVTNKSGTKGKIAGETTAVECLRVVNNLKGEATEADAAVDAQSTALAQLKIDTKAKEKDGAWANMGGDAEWKAIQAEVSTMKKEIKIATKELIRKKVARGNLRVQVQKAEGLLARTEEKVKQRAAVQDGIQKTMAAKYNQLLLSADKTAPAAGVTAKSITQREGEAAVEGEAADADADAAAPAPAAPTLATMAPKVITAAEPWQPWKSSEEALFNMTLKKEKLRLIESTMKDCKEAFVLQRAGDFITGEPKTPAQKKEENAAHKEELAILRADLRAVKADKQPVGEYNFRAFE